MSGRHSFPQLEQDLHGPGDDLPTYDDLAEKNGPNSRFGRWRGWIEKRAAERYHDLSPEELTRRKARGWGGEDLDPQNVPVGSQGNISIILNESPTPPLAPMPLHLRIHTDLPSIPQQEDPLDRIIPSPQLPPPPSLGEQLSPSRLRVNQFGSRFLPHAESQIRCLLPLLNDRLLLIGHDEGLSVLDMFPQEWTEAGNIATKGPDEASARLMWEGEAVHQMSILEIESIGEGTPQGVVLALVGPEVESPREQESLRTLRMYNLASLISLAKYTVAQKGTHPVVVPPLAKWDTQSSQTKKHRSQSSITKGLRSLIEPPVAQSSPHTASYQSLIPSNIQSDGATLSRIKSTDSDAAWYMVEDLPLRWATDYVCLAAAGSRLVNTSVNCYSLWHQGQGGALLAVATKSNILLYEKPTGERAFRFVKEFYTPLQARNLTFVQQSSVQDMTRSLSDVGRQPARQQPIGSTDTLHDVRSTRPTVSRHNTQLSLFVVFDKKAGMIRLVDSAVGEVELASIGFLNPESSHTRDLSSNRRSRLSDVHNINKGPWVLPTRLELPAVTSGPHPTLPRTVYFLTRGKETHVLPSPLPAIMSNNTPLFTSTWTYLPSSVTPRVCYPSKNGAPPFLQLVALGEDGVEVQEVSLSFLNRGKGKGRAEEPVRAFLDISAGFLCTGGLWDQPGFAPQLTRSLSCASDVSATSSSSVDKVEFMSRLQGIYGWCQKDLRDWRVFWVGGTGRDERGDGGQ